MGRLVAIVSWAFGLWATYENIEQAGLSVVYSVLIAFFVQSALTRLQSGLWRGKWSIPAIGACFIDSWLNFYFLGPIFVALPQWGSYQQSVEVFGIPSDPPAWTLGAVALVIGGLIAILPEYVWERS